jgi:hypothetical protein
VTRTRGGPSPAAHARVIAGAMTAASAAVGERAPCRARHASCSPTPNSSRRVAAPTPQTSASAGGVGMEPAATSSTTALTVAGSTARQHATKDVDAVMTFASFAPGPAREGLPFARAVWVLTVTVAHTPDTPARVIHRPRGGRPAGGGPGDSGAVRRQLEQKSSA